VFLAELFDAHAPMVLGLCRGLLRDAHEAEDAAQQTFLSAYGSLVAGTLPRQPAAWLATIARNECRTRAQRRMREPLPVAETLVLAGDPFDEAVQAAEVESLRRALTQLPRQQRDALVLREFTGLSYEELALAFGVSEPAIESLLFRARRQVRTALRAAAAAALSAPVGLRDAIAQFFGSSGDGAGPATLAKLGSFPLGIKLAAVGAGGVIGAATVVVTAPTRHHGRAAVQARPARHVVAARKQTRPGAAPTRAATVGRTAAERPVAVVEHAVRVPHATVDRRRESEPARTAEPEPRAAPEPEPETEVTRPDEGAGSGDVGELAPTAVEGDAATSENSGEGSTMSGDQGSSGAGASGDGASSGGDGPG
jgi:RNA polymerase sigma-70 factor (ECF subfamily)